MTKKTSKDYEAIGRVIADAYDASSADKRRVLRMSFLKGVTAGFGGAVGATLVVALLVWVLSWFNSVPFVNTITRQVQHTLQSQR